MKRASEFDSGAEPQSEKPSTEAADSSILDSKIRTAAGLENEEMLKEVRDAPAADAPDTGAADLQ